MDLPTFWAKISTLIVLCSALICVGIFIYKFTKFLSWRNTLNKIPGPPGLPFLGNLFDVTSTTDVLFSTMQLYANKYYPIYKLSVGLQAAVIIRSPADIEMIVSGVKHLRKSKTYIPLEPWLKDGLLLSNGAKWQARRKLLTPTFHFGILSQFTKVFIEQSEILVKNIHKVANKPTDVLPLVTNFALKSICETAMGTRIDEGTSNEKYKDAVYKMSELVVDRVLTPWYLNPYIHLFSRNYWKSRSTLKYLHNFATNVIKARKETYIDRSRSTHIDNDGDKFNSKRHMVLLDLLLSAKFNGAQIDDVGIQEEVDTFMFGGHDTTSASISFSLMLLACNKGIQEKVYKELKDIFGDSGRQITTGDLNEMKYLERVIKESLRLYPSAGIIGRLTSETVRTPSGYTIPKGTTVLIKIYDLHHDERIYEDSDRFDPDRFLQANSKGRHPYAYIPFSAGPRNCIGQKFAMLQMKTVLATILRNFELNPVDTPKTITLQVDIMLRTTNGIKVEFKPRM